VLFGRVRWFSGGLGGLCASDGLSGPGVHAKGAARGAFRLYKRGAEAPRPATTFLGVPPGVGVTAVPALPLDVPLPLGCTFFLPAAAAYTAAARRGRVVWATSPGASLVLVLLFFPTPFSLVIPPSPLSPVDIAPLRRLPAKAPASAERAAQGGTLWPVQLSRARTTAEPPSPATCRLGVPDGAPARLLVLTSGGGAGRGGEEPTGVRLVAAWTCGEHDAAGATSKTRASAMGKRKRTYTEAMLAAATAALEDADREGFGRPEPFARARAFPVRARRSARRASASPATVAASDTAAAPGAAPGTCGAAGPANSDAGGGRRRFTRLDTARLDTASLGTAHSINDGGEGGRGDDGGDGARGDGGNDGGDGARGDGAHYDVVGGHQGLSGYAFRGEREYGYTPMRCI